MSDERLLTISTFARAVSVPASALRFYSGEGVLVPAEVDPFTGYRYYAPSQIDAGVLVGRLRAAGVAVPLMKEILHAGSLERAELIDQIIANLSAQSRRREQDLVALRESLHDASQSRQSARAALPGPVLASAIGQVIAATSGASDDVSGLVWSLRDDRLELLATDRYWLASRRLSLRDVDGAARAMTSPEAAAAMATACAQRLEVALEIDGDRLRLLGSDGEVLEETSSIERAVPDLSLLVSSQPPVRAAAGFDSTALDGLLLGPVAERHVVVDTRRAEMVGGDRSIPGWVATVTGPDISVRIQLQTALLSAAVSLCLGPEIVLGIVDGSTPVRVSSPLQDTVTCLVMPMRP